MTSSTAPTTDQLSPAEAAALGSGADFWSTKSRASLPSVIVTDGPHGIRKQESSADHLGINGSVRATCFPPAVGLSQSWDVDLAQEIGEALAVESQAHGVGVLLGPGVNIKRDPRCGRNFEYFSEDPYLTGVLATAWVQGLQGGGVGASLKHFAANNAENDRMRSSSDIDERPLREIYLRAFQRVVEQASPWTVMCSYNRINGIPAAENRWLLTEVLRDRWGFDGAVISDWGAVDDRIASVEAGLDLVMPGPDPTGDAKVAQALVEGTVSEAAVERSVTAVSRLLERAAASRQDGAVIDEDAHHALARRAAGRSIVLLKNDGDVLPLADTARIAVIGTFARTPRFQGGGSSRVNASRVDVPLDEIRAVASDVTYAAGTGEDVDGLRIEAASTAAAADVAVLFLGITEGEESEGYDRDDIDLAADQLALLDAVVAAQPRTVVVLAHGGVLDLSHVSRTAPALIDTALLGQAVGGAIADVLFGSTNPSGRLSETVPVRLEDAPAYLSFASENSRIRYGEGLFVGYRWYDARKLEVTYPFGHGLSYTTFAYDKLALRADEEGVVISVRVMNTGSRSGREVVQAYVTAPENVTVRAPRELKAFASVELVPGESQIVTLRVPRKELAYWETRISDWVTAGGEYTVAVGASSRDLRATGLIEIEADPNRIPLTRDSTVGEAFANPAAGAVLAAGLAAAMGDAPDAGEHDSVDVVRLISTIPLRRMAAPPASIPDATIDAVIAAANDGIS